MYTAMFYAVVLGWDIDVICHVVSAVKESL